MIETIYSGPLLDPSVLFNLLPERLQGSAQASGNVQVVRERRDGATYTALIDLDARMAVQVWEDDAPATDIEPELLPAVPTFSAELAADSDTATVAAWSVSHGLQASVVRAWVWVDPHAQVGRDRTELEALLRANGVKLARRRQSFFHTCGVETERTPGKRPSGGKLERFHGTVSAAEYNPRTFNPAPAWVQAKEARKVARRKR